MFDLEVERDFLLDRHPEFNSGSHQTETRLLDVMPDQVRQDRHLFETII